MRKELYRKGMPGRKWGVIDTKTGAWVSNVIEDTPMLAIARLYSMFEPNKRYEVRILPQRIHDYGTDFV